MSSATAETAPPIPTIGGDPSTVLCWRSSVCARARTGASDANAPASRTATVARFIPSERPAELQVEKRLEAAVVDRVIFVVLGHRDVHEAKLSIDRETAVERVLVAKESANGAPPGRVRERAAALLEDGLGSKVKVVDLGADRDATPEVSGEVVASLQPVVEFQVRTLPHQTSY